MESNKFNSENMMHSIKSMNKGDTDCTNEMNMAKDKTYHQKEAAEQEINWDMDWASIMGASKDTCCNKENKCENKCENKMVSKYESKDSKINEKVMMPKEMSKCKEKDYKKDCDMMIYATMMQENKAERKGVMIGEKMPQMTVKTTVGEKTLPNDYMGKWLVLFSHPGDFTPVCTTEFVSFAKNYENFKQLDTELLGLSVDQVQPHIKWIEWIEDKLCTPIPFPVIADPMGVAASELGMIHNTKSSHTVRAVFIIDPEGIIRMILYYPEQVGRNIEEIIRSVAALQVADKHNVAMPANWPSNELIGEKVIVPTAQTIEKAKQNQENYCNYDWWFCYKELE